MQFKRNKATEKFKVDKVVYSQSLKVSIPSIGLTQYVSTQKDMAIGLKEGVWHVPYTTFPGEIGNIVIVGHSVDYSSFLPPPFFYLNRVHVDDEVIIEYKGEEYIYSC